MTFVAYEDDASRVRKLKTLEELVGLGGGGGSDLSFKADGLLTVERRNDTITYGINVSSLISDEAYDATTWDSVTNIGASKNALRDKFEALVSTEGNFNFNTGHVRVNAATIPTAFDTPLYIETTSTDNYIGMLAIPDDALTTTTDKDVVVIGGAPHDNTDGIFTVVGVKGRSNENYVYIGGGGFGLDDATHVAIFVANSIGTDQGDAHTHFDYTGARHTMNLGGWYSTTVSEGYWFRNQMNDAGVYFSGPFGCCSTKYFYIHENANHIMLQTDATHWRFYDKVTVSQQLSIGQSGTGSAFAQGDLNVRPDADNIIVHLVSNSATTQTEDVIRYGTDNDADEADVRWRVLAGGGMEVNHQQLGQANADFTVHSQNIENILHVDTANDTVNINGVDPAGFTFHSMMLVA